MCMSAQAQVNSGFSLHGFTYECSFIFRFGRLNEVVWWAMPSPQNFDFPSLETAYSNAFSGAKCMQKKAKSKIY